MDSVVFEIKAEKNSKLFASESGQGSFEEILKKCDSIAEDMK